MLSQKEFAFLDGELLVGNGDNFQAVTSAIMSQKGEPEFTFHVFDWFGDPTLPYTARLISYKRIVRQLQDRFPFLRAVYTEIVNDEDELKAFTAKCLADGYEGAMVRRPTSPYKFGRATFKEGYLTKVKPFEDDEAEIVGFEEQMENRNEKTVNELGKSKRSSHQANKVPKGTLGALIVKHKTFGEFNIGTGFDDAFRKMVWSNRSAYLGQLVKFRYQLAGMKDKPRIPSFKGLRHPFDL
jgi:DNA ligase-1